MSTPSPRNDPPPVSPAPPPPTGAAIHAPPPGRAVAATEPLQSVPPDLAALQQYQILREISRGGMGLVYLARNTTLDRLEVLKVLNTAGLNRPGVLERFLREMRSAARLQHPNVVTAYAAFQVGHSIVFAMEYIEGSDLAKVVRDQGPLPVVHAAYYTHQAARGLQHAHEKGMIHRDIKPSNLMLQKVGKKHTIKILDFGLAKASIEGEARSDLTGLGRMLGTPDFIAPEQTRDAANADIRADLYSLGCTLYFLLAGQPPFKGRGMYEVLEAHQFHTPRPLTLIRPEVPAELAAIVAKLMAKDPAQRYQTPAEVLTALAPFIRPTNSMSIGHPPARAEATAEPPSSAETIPPAGSTSPVPTVPRKPAEASAALTEASAVQDERPSSEPAARSEPLPLRQVATWVFWAFTQATTFLLAATGFAYLTADAANPAPVPGAASRFFGSAVLVLGLYAVFGSLTRDPSPGSGFRLRWADGRVWAGSLLLATLFGITASDYLGFRQALTTWLWVVSLLLAIVVGMIIPLLLKRWPSRTVS
jgi:serine/threonine protein kinase